eukprot:358155-Chlamydomonas_euryale.AAC.3
MYGACNGPNRAITDSQIPERGRMCLKLAVSQSQSKLSDSVPCQALAVHSYMAGPDLGMPVKSGTQHCDIRWRTSQQSATPRRTKAFAHKLSDMST